MHMFLNNSITELLGVISSVFGIISGVFFIYKYFYDRKLKFYLWVNKIFSGRREVHFDLSYSFNYSGKELFNTFENLAENNDLKYKIELNSRNRKMYNFDNMIVDVVQNEVIDDGQDDRNVFIRVINAGVTLNTAQNIINSFGKLTSHIPEKVQIDNQMYNFQVKYSENKNPFISMKLKLMSQNNLTSFHSRIDASRIVPNNNEITDIDIYKQSLSVNNSDFLSISNIAKTLLAA